MGVYKSKNLAVVHAARFLFQCKIILGIAGDEGVSSKYQKYST